MRRLIVCLSCAAVPAVAVAKPPALEVTSPAFSAGGSIPTPYTCEGAEAAPPLAWSEVPAGTRSIAILVDDPDAPRGTFTHWLVTGIPPATSSLANEAALPATASEGLNDRGTRGYVGPCPPSGRHRYRFRVYALDIAKPAATTRAAFLRAIEGHVLATGELVGTYEKRRTGP